MSQSHLNEMVTYGYGNIMIVLRHKNVMTTTHQHQKDTTTPVYDNVMTLERRQSLVTSIQASRVETFKILFEKKVYTIEVIPLKDVSITNDDVELKDGI